MYFALWRSEMYFRFVALFLASNFPNFHWVNVQLTKYSVSMGTKTIKYLNQSESRNLDEELFSDYGFSVDQLMELAGLSCAHAIAKSYPKDNFASNRVLVLCGPGNNGGDGLVCARHLKLFGYLPEIIYPRRTESSLYAGLTRQCSKFDIPIFDTLTYSTGEINSRFKIVVDSLFGFSFKPPVRPQFKDVIQLLSQVSVPVVSVDVPSGWHVESGPLEGEASFQPECLISLTAPKLCAKYFTGNFHYLGGRFIPDTIAIKYKLNLPDYPDQECVIILN